MSVGVSTALAAAVDVTTTEVVVRTGVDIDAVGGAASAVGVTVGEPHAARVRDAIKLSEVPPFLQAVAKGARTVQTLALVDRKDCAKADIEIDIQTAVERIIFEVIDKKSTPF